MPEQYMEMLKATHSKLSEEEIKNPHLVIHQFFDYAGLDDLRGYLWEWLKLSVTGTFNTRMVDKYKRYDLLLFYEHIEKLIEATYIIYLRNKKQKRNQ
jgi:hypothetical protein